MHSFSRAFQFFSILMIPVTALCVFAPATDAERVSSAKTNPRHWGRPLEQIRLRLKRISVPKRTKYVNPAKRGLIFTSMVARLFAGSGIGTILGAAHCGQGLGAVLGTFFLRPAI